MPITSFERSAEATVDNQVTEVQVETPEIVEEKPETFVTPDGIEVTVDENYHDDDDNDTTIVGVTEGEAYDIGFNLAETHDLDCPDCEDGDDPENNEDPESEEGSVG